MVRFAARGSVAYGSHGMNGKSVDEVYGLPVVQFSTVRKRAPSPDLMENWGGDEHGTLKEWIRGRPIPELTHGGK